MIINIFSFLASKLWENIQGLFVLAYTIAIISCLLVQAIKNANEIIFKKAPFKSNIIFIINGVLNFIISNIITLVFDGLSNWYKTILYIFLVFLFAWALSLIFYDYFLKYILYIFQIIENKLKNIRDKK